MVLSITVKRPVLLYTAALALVLFLAYNYQPILRRSSFRQHNMTPWSSKYEGWHGRATFHPSPETFTPTREILAFAVLHHAPAIPDGFTLALFKPDVAVDARGKVLILNPDDFTGLSDLARQTLDLPSTGSFMNAWRIAQRRTDQPIERLFVPGSTTALVETSVQGYEKGKTELKTPVGDIHELPEVLHELFGLIAEARDGYERGKEDEDTISKVKAVLGDV
ncbi:unnamed protein product [Somion occarium]|uniref:Uncharacterized protein n=1 Tax=Somion occarium TaxID=3059160 RepID=A0ABP1DAP3_9APHY